MTKKSIFNCFFALLTGLLFILLIKIAKSHQQQLSTVSTMSIENKPKPQPTPYHDFDYLIFSQRWPLTACTEWQESNVKNICQLPKNRDTWTVHGIWPTKNGQMGPLFCPSAIHFDPDQILSILTDLEEKWTNIEENTKNMSFWQHEWRKHGTCAAVLPQFDSVVNYFAEGLSLNDKYDITQILATNGIKPDNTVSYDLTHIVNVILTAVNVKPDVQCVIDRRTKENYISEIRLCFDKTLTLIDCHNNNTNCNMKKPIQYIQELPATLQQQETNTFDSSRSSQQFELYLKLYNFIKAISWITL